MNKKKTIIMTVIAVIVLVTMLVGATYAYFSANNSASGTTTLEATAEEIGVVTVTNPTSDLYLRLSAVEMAEANQGTNYYATSTNSDGYVYSSTEEYNSIANMKVTGGVTDTKYSCSFKINITKPSTIKSGDMSITFKTDDTINPTIIGVTSGTPIDLYSASSEYTASFEATGEHTSGYDIISTAIRLNNTTSDQIYLSGENLGVSITLSDINCEVSKVEEEESAETILQQSDYVNMTFVETGSFVYDDLSQSWSVGEYYEDSVDGSFNLADDGNYQLCYSVEIWQDDMMVYNGGSVYVDNVKKGDFITSGDYAECIDLGSLMSTSQIRIYYKTNYNMPGISFYVKRINY